MKQEYTLIFSLTIIQFEGLIEEHLNEGWKCQGGVNVCIDGIPTSQRIYTQGMIRSKE